MAQYYYNLVTKEIEQGPQSPAEQLMGPYSSVEEAKRALEIAAERNERWDEEDEAWENFQN